MNAVHVCQRPLPPLLQWHCNVAGVARGREERAGGPARLPRTLASALGATKMACDRLNSLLEAGSLHSMMLQPWSSCMQRASARHGPGQSCRGGPLPHNAALSSPAFPLCVAGVPCIVHPPPLLHQSHSAAPPPAALHNQQLHHHQMQGPTPASMSNVFQLPSSTH